MSDITELNSDLVLAAAMRLIHANGKTTTLEVKEEARLRHPGVVFTQNIVSDVMAVLEGLNFFEYTDNGKYRTYTLNVAYLLDDKEPEEKEVILSRFDALSVINGLEKDDEVTITFTKKNGNERTIVGIVHTPNLGLGTLLVYDTEKPDGPNGTNIRSVDLRKLISFSIDNLLYKVQ